MERYYFSFDDDLDDGDDDEPLDEHIQSQEVNGINCLSKHAICIMYYLFDSCKPIWLSLFFVGEFQCHIYIKTKLLLIHMYELHTDMLCTYNVHIILAEILAKK